MIARPAHRLPAADRRDRRRPRRPLDRQHRGQVDDHRRAVRSARCCAGRVRRLPGRRPRALSRAGLELVRLGRPHGRMGASGRHADGGDAGGGDDRLQPRPPLQLGLYGGGPGPAALLRLSVAVQLRDADAGDRRQPRPDVLRLGRRRPRFLSADRLLVPQAVGQCGGAEGVRRQPGRRFRLQPRHFRHLPGVRHRVDPGDPRGRPGNGGIDHRLRRASASTP